LDGTIVCYAGPDRLPTILSSLLSNGRPPEDSAAVIYGGTLPTQETHLGSIDELLRLTRESTDRRPAILVVGRVAALREHLRRLRQHGLKVDLTPAEYRAEAVVRALREAVDVRGLKVLLPRSDIGREVIANELRKLGADVTEVVAYRTAIAEPEREGEPDIYRM